MFKTAFILILEEYIASIIPNAAFLSIFEVAGSVMDKTAFVSIFKISLLSLNPKLRLFRY